MTIDLLNFAVSTHYELHWCMQWSCWKLIEIYARHKITQNNFISYSTFFYLFYKRLQVNFRIWNEFVFVLREILFIRFVSRFLFLFLLKFIDGFCFDLNIYAPILIEKWKSVLYFTEKKWQLILTKLKLIHLVTYLWMAFSFM